ncbi:MAG: CPBP family intramembrane glutamic endopeptidase [Chitinophagaceae bacterium]
MDHNKARGLELLNFPITKMVIGMIVCLGAGLIGKEGIQYLLDFTQLSQADKDLVGISVFATLVVMAYRSLFKIYEKRNIPEWCTHRLEKWLMAGILLGGGLQSLTICVMYLNHDFGVISVNRLIPLLPNLISVFDTSVVAEVLFIGIIFRITEAALGSYLALGILTLMFGIIHSLIAHGTLIGGLAIALNAGLLLGAAFMYSRNLWFPIAIHFAWDFTQSGIFGASVAGYTVKQSLLTTKITGSPQLSGGYFGPQSSVQSGLFCLMAALVFLAASHRQHSIIQFPQRIPLAGENPHPSNPTPRQGRN